MDNAPILPKRRTPPCVQWSAPHRHDTAVAHRTESWERFTQPAIAVHRPGDVYSSQLFIQRLATGRQSKAVIFCLFFFFQLEFLP